MPTPTPAGAACTTPHPLVVHFYNVGQALAAMVELPGGRHVMVDAGDDSRRAGCASCEGEHRHLLEAVTRDLAGAPVDLLWITHAHSDHVGGAADLLAHLDVRMYIDNGRGGDRSESARARSVARSRSATLITIDPADVATAKGMAPLAAFSAIDPAVTLRAVVPRAWSEWPKTCDRDENECSIALRIDDCASSVLFTGDAEKQEETGLDTFGAVTLLQVGHHGSDTSSSAHFLAAVAPKYAVISAGARDDDRNRDYCHPRARAVQRVSQALGGDASGSIAAFSGSKCGRGASSDDDEWTNVPVSAHLYATERDGDITLVSNGDGVFTRR